VAHRRTGKEEMTRRFLTALASVLLLSGTAGASDGESLQICIAAAADYSAVYPTRNIPASLRQVSAVFHFAPGEIHDVTGTWYAVDVGKAMLPNHRLAATTLRERNKGSFVLTFPQAFPRGKYRLDVTVAGALWKSAVFEVVADLPAPQVARPEDLIPATPGRTWTYDFIQQAGEGATIDLPNIKPDAQGRYRTTVVMTLVGTDPAGRHIEMRRDGKLVFEEWQRFTADGVAVTKRKSADAVIVLDPPQVIWRWPLHSPSSWTYSLRGRSYEQTFRMWGPVPIETPSGERAGFLVLGDQRSKAVHYTAARAFVPGIGLVREVDITALNGDMVSRQEMVLKR
jgi:hypothetical protein